MALNVKGQLKEAQLETLASDPANLPHGRAWYDTVLNKVKFSISGVAKIIPTVDSTDTITNKTISGSSNTLSNIALTSLSTTTASRAIVSDGSGVLFPSTVTATELGYVSGVTSAIQTQLNAKAPSASPTFTGTVTLPATVTGASAQVLTLPASTGTLALVGVAAFASKTANYTATSSDEVLTCDATSATITITLPTAVGITGKKYVIKRIDAHVTNEVIVDPNSTQTIDGATTLDIINQYDSVDIVSDGANWVITADNRTKESVAFSTGTTGSSQTANTWITLPLNTVYGNSKYTLSSNAWTVKKTSRYRLMMQNSVIAGNGELIYVTYSVNGASESSNWINSYLVDANPSGSTTHVTEVRDVLLTKGDVIRLRARCDTNTRNSNNGRMTVTEL